MSGRNLEGDPAAAATLPATWAEVLRAPWPRVLALLMDKLGLEAITITRTALDDFEASAYGGGCLVWEPHGDTLFARLVPAAEAPLLAWAERCTSTLGPLLLYHAGAECLAIRSADLEAWLASGATVAAAVVLEPRAGLSLRLVGPARASSSAAAGDDRGASKSLEVDTAPNHRASSSCRREIRRGGGA